MKSLQVKKSQKAHQASLLETTLMKKSLTHSTHCNYI